MRRLPFLIAAAAGASLALAAAARADTPTPEVGDPVPGHPGVTYLDLLRQAIPDLAENAANKDVEGHLAKPLRSLAGPGGGDAPDPVVVDFVQDLRFNADGRPRMAVMADLGQAEDSAQSTTLVAVFDNAPKPKLLDFADVGLDKDTSFDQHPKLALGPGDDALVSYSEHSNSDQTYSQWLIFFLRHGRLQEIDGVAAFSDRFCGYERDETPVLTTRPDAGSPYRRIDAVITETLKHTGDDCGDQAVPKAYVRTWRGGWRWNAAKRDFKALGDDFGRLDKLNEGRY